MGEVMLLPSPAPSSCRSTAQGLCAALCRRPTACSTVWNRLTVWDRLAVWNGLCDGLEDALQRIHPALHLRQALADLLQPLLRTLLRGGRALGELAVLRLPHHLDLRAP